MTEVQIWEAEENRLYPRCPHDALKSEDLHPGRQRDSSRCGGATAAGDKSQHRGWERIDNSATRAVYMRRRNKLSACKHGVAAGCWCV